MLATGLRAAPGREMRSRARALMERMSQGPSTCSRKNPLFKWIGEDWRFMDLLKQKESIRKSWIQDLR
jgi:hypothetical protein